MNSFIETSNFDSLISGSNTYDVLPYSNFLDDMLAKPNHQNQFSCAKCNRVYKHKNNLYRHVRFECGVNPQFQCPMCPFKAKQKDNLKSHMLVKHNKNPSLHI